MADWIKPGELLEEEVSGLIASLAGSFTKDQVEAIQLAAKIGCGLIISSAESLAIIPHDEKPGTRAKRIHISARKPVPLHRMMKQIRRIGDPAITQRLDQMSIAMHDETDPKKLAEQIGQWDAYTSSLEPSDAMKVEVMVPQFESPKEKHVPTQQEVEEKVKKERHIISERPALMHRNITSKGGQSYPSRTTIERRWSDGKIEYVCAVPGCDQTSDNRLAFRGPHYAMHVRKGEAEPLDGEEQKQVVDDPSYTEPAYTKKGTNKRLAGLTSLIQSLDLEVISVEDLAQKIEDYLQSLYSGGGGGGNGEPLTDEQVLDRIRSLVDRGNYAAQEQVIQEQAQQIEDLTSYSDQRVNEIDRQRMEAEQRAVKAEAHLEALRDLINEKVTP